MHDAVQAQRLADIRRAHATCVGLMSPRSWVCPRHGFLLESGDLSHTELGTLQSYVAAIGGQLRIVAGLTRERLS